MEGGCAMPISGGWRGEGRPQTVTFPWWVPKTERITSEISLDANIPDDPQVRSMIEAYRRESP